MWSSQKVLYKFVLAQFSCDKFGLPWQGRWLNLNNYLHYFHSHALMNEWGVSQCNPLVGDLKKSKGFLCCIRTPMKLRQQNTSFMCETVTYHEAWHYSFFFKFCRYPHNTVFSYGQIETGSTPQPDPNVSWVCFSLFCSLLPFSGNGQWVTLELTNWRVCGTVLSWRSPASQYSRTGNAWPPSDATKNTRSFSNHAYIARPSQRDHALFPVV